MKGLIFAGCSFTWGQGLYYYSKLSTLKEPPPMTYDSKLLTDAHIRYMATLRYPRLVANHFNTFEVVSKQNGGSDESSINFINAAFGLKEGFGHFIEEVFSPSEIGYVIIQTSQINRNTFYYNYKGEEKWFNANVAHTKSDFYEWLIEERKISIDQWKEEHIKFYFSEMKNLMTFLENRGVKTRILFWENDYLNLSQDDIFMYNRSVKLDFRGEEFNTIAELMERHPHLAIGRDYDNLEKPPQDYHPSKECHQIIANSVIKSIEKDSQNELESKFEVIIDTYEDPVPTTPVETPKRSLI